jgi:Polyketide cyclase / dehydrase and lipid transport
MATVRKTVEINLSAVAIWDAVRDVGNLHLRLAPGLVADCRLNDDGTERIVTFADGTILPEKIIAIEEAAMRIVWSAQNPSLAHHNAAMEVSPIDEDHSTVSWTADLLPDQVAGYMAPFIETGLATMKAHLEGGSSIPPKAD